MNANTVSPILICYDGSEGARRAIETTGRLFPGRSALVLHAWSPIAIVAESYGGAVAMPAYDDEALRAEASKLAEDGSKLAKEAGLDARPEIAEVTFKGTTHTILDCARRYDAALVVLGARGLSTFKSLVLGSVSHSIAQHAHVPVLIVPPPSTEDTAPTA